MLLLKPFQRQLLLDFILLERVESVVAKQWTQPRLGLLHLAENHLELLTVQRPGGLICHGHTSQIFIQERRVTLETNFQMRGGNGHVQMSRTNTRGRLDEDTDLVQSLFPFVDGASFVLKFVPDRSNHYNFSIMRVGVIGAGVAGLQALRSLKSKSNIASVVCLEQAAKVGGVWRENYFGAKLQVPGYLYEFPDHRLAPGTSELPTRSQVQTYIEDFVDAHDLRPLIKFNERVTSVFHNPSTKTWKVTTSETEQEFDALIVATGLYSSHPKLPPEFALAPPADARVNVLHSSQVISPEQCQGKRMVTIGFGKSALDLAYFGKTLGGALESTLVFRKPNWIIPLNVMNILPFEYLFLSRFGQALVTLRHGGWPGGAETLAHRVQKAMPQLSRSVSGLVFGLLEFIFHKQSGLPDRFRPTSELVPGFFGCSQIHDKHMFAALRSGDVFNLTQGSVAKVDQNAGCVELQDGSRIACDLLVLATGFSKSYSLFDAKTQSILEEEEDGPWLYRNMVHPDLPNLFFCGSEADLVLNATFFGIQAEWIARRLASQTPSWNQEELGKMREEIQARKLWAREWIPSRQYGSRSKEILVFQLDYVDSLLRDMGEDPRRKTNPLSEFFMPSFPQDYDGIIR